jgi:hypothetical protein
MMAAANEETRLSADEELTSGMMSGAMVIKMEDINNCGARVMFIGERSRLASCTGVKLVDKERLVACNLVGQRMYLVRYDLDRGRHEIEDCIPTRFGDKDVCTDLIDGDNRNRFVTSNCEHSSVSIYRLKNKRLQFEKDLPIPEEKPGYCHSARFVPPDGEIICTTTVTCEKSVYFLRVKSGEIVCKLRDNDNEWRPKDVCFLDDSRIFVIFTHGGPRLGKAASYDSKVSLIALNIESGRHEVISELMINGHVDSCRHFGERLYITNGGRDCVTIVRFKGNRLTLDHEMLGYNFPHGIDLLPGVLAVTNYGNNSIVLSKMDSSTTLPQEFHRLWRRGTPLLSALWQKLKGTGSRP